MKKVSFLFVTAAVFFGYPALGDDVVRTPISVLHLPSLFEVTEHLEGPAGKSRDGLSHQEMQCYQQITAAFVADYNAQDSVSAHAAKGMGVKKITFAFNEWPKAANVQIELIHGFQGVSADGLHADQLLIPVDVSQNGCSDIKALMDLIRADARVAASKLDANDAKMRRLAEEESQRIAKETEKRATDAALLAADQAIANGAADGLNAIANSMAASAQNDSTNKPAVNLAAADPAAAPAPAKTSTTTQAK